MYYVYFVGHGRGMRSFSEKKEWTCTNLNSNALSCMPTSNNNNFDRITT